LALLSQNLACRATSTNIRTAMTIRPKQGMMMTIQQRLS
jgi:hypothetical protein